MYTKSIQSHKISGLFRAPDFVQLACRWNCSIRVQNNHGTYDPKSIMAMMSFNPKDGAITVFGDGPDEKEAVDSLVDFLIAMSD